MRPAVVILTERGAGFRVLNGIAGMIMPVVDVSQVRTPNSVPTIHVADARFTKPDGRAQVWSLGEGDYILPRAGEPCDCEQFRQAGFCRHIDSYGDRTGARCICNEGFGLNLSCPIHAPKRVPPTADNITSHINNALQIVGLLAHQIDTAHPGESLGMVKADYVDSLAGVTARLLAARSLADGR